MTFIILFVSVLALIGVAIASGIIVRNSSEKRRGGAPPKGKPVTLDRSPEMPHRPGATS